MREFTLENVLAYIDEAIERQKFGGTWLDDQYDKHTTDVGYVCEGLEIMKNELIRTFADTKIDVSCDGKMLESKKLYKIGEKYFYFDSEDKLIESDKVPDANETTESRVLTEDALKMFEAKMANYK